MPESLSPFAGCWSCQNSKSGELWRERRKCGRSGRRPDSAVDVAALTHTGPPCSVSQKKTGPRFDHLLIVQLPTLVNPYYPITRRSSLAANLSALLIAVIVAHTYGRLGYVPIRLDWLPGPVVQVTMPYRARTNASWESDQSLRGQGCESLNISRTWEGPPICHVSEKPDLERALADPSAAMQGCIYPRLAVAQFGRSLYRPSSATQYVHQVIWIAGLRLIYAIEGSRSLR